MNPVLRYALVYGWLVGAAIIGTTLVLLVTSGQDHADGSVFLGYLIMLVAMVLIFVGLKRYRDVEKGGVIRFLPALGVGMAISLMAALAYVVLWEVYMWATDYTFLDKFIATQTEIWRAQGMPAAELAKKVAEMDAMRVWYANPVWRMLITFMEIAVVTPVVPLISAALLRNPKFLPAREKAPD
ncbi:DUF4199 domain-containing protein [Sphingomonas sp. AOB5]|uniref:DUF4199 domain-containing protein n=1 Tax=Sphingomonas sp. AOB5 TaxID=3034017 RepID=UPI0023F7E125|nr:DUF4199 domain-containing protein [Sphingomonas sp. AOB5]MDF7775229.1 DUF4199 domain-containing protein [Sphingomonas sp. AOB5]